MQIVYKKNTLYVLTDYLSKEKEVKLKRIMNLYGIDNVVIKEDNKVSYKI